MIMFTVSYLLADDLSDAYSASHTEYDSLDAARAAASELTDAVRSGSFGPSDCVCIQISDADAVLETVYNTLPA